MRVPAQAGLLDERNALIDRIRATGHGAGPRRGPRQGDRLRAAEGRAQAMADGGA